MDTLDNIIKRVEARNPNEPEFFQAVEEVVSSIYPFLKENEDYVKNNVIDTTLKLLKHINEIRKNYR